MARDLGVQNRVRWLFSTGSRIHRARSKQNDGNPHKNENQQVFECVLLCVTAHTSEETTLQQQRRFKLFPLITANRASESVRACVRVCACVPSDLPGLQVYDSTRGIRNTNISRTAVQFRQRSCICFALLSAAAVSILQGPSFEDVAATVLQQQLHFNVFP